MMQKSGELISDILSDDFQTVGTETTIEFNLSVLKVKHTVKKRPKELSQFVISGLISSGSSGHRPAIFISFSQI
jgi:hypothetical protein